MVFILRAAQELTRRLKISQDQLPIPVRLSRTTFYELTKTGILFHYFDKSYSQEVEANHMRLFLISQLLHSTKTYSGLKLVHGLAQYYRSLNTLPTTVAIIITEPIKEYFIECKDPFA